MNDILGIVLAFLFLLIFPQFSGAQAIFEYGKQLEGIGERQRILNPKGSGRPHERQRSGPVERRGELGDRVSSSPAPSMLSVKGKEAYLYVRQDRNSTVVGKLSQGEELATIAQSFERDGTWFMVKTQKGTLGWISSSEVTEVAPKKK